MAEKNDAPPADGAQPTDDIPATDDASAHGAQPTPPQHGTPPHGAPGTNRFFTWMRGLAIVRQNGWIGGVCGGVAARLGIDPIIVRGIAVVVVILGGPALLLYAAAWLLLPDSSDDIHLERLIRGHFEPAVVAIAAIALLTLLPVTQGIWWAGSQFWGEPFWPASVGRTLWTLLVIGAIIAVVIWAARTNRFSSRADVPGGQTAGSQTAAGQPAGGQTAGGTDARTASAHPSSPGFVAQNTASPTAPTAPTAPTPPAASSSPEELEAWKRSQAEWKTEHDVWRAKQAADERAVRAQRSAELRAQAREMAAHADEARRRRRMANPRTSGAYVGITIGVAILAGAISAAIAAGSTSQGNADASAYAVTIGFAVATLAVGLSIMLAGVLRRRSGFLTFVSIVLIVISVATALPPRGRDLVLGYASHNQVSNARVYMPVGAYSVYLDPGMDEYHGTHVIDIDQTVGGVQVTIVRGLTVRVDATQQNNRGSLTATTLTGTESTSQLPERTGLPDGELRSSITYGSAKTPDVIVRISQWVGSVNVTYDTSRSDQSEPTQKSTPSPTAPATPSTAAPTP
jgi:phage shock protein PspC (stress-responsive transcriptional regulator)